MILLCCLRGCYTLGAGGLQAAKPKFPGHDKTALIKQGFGKCYTAGGMNTSEKLTQEWLHQVGANSISFCGGPSSGGPPDFVFDYFGETVVAESRHLPDSDGWGPEREIAVSREISRIYEEEFQKGARSHVIPKYDTRQPFSAMRDRSWKDRARKAMWPKSEMKIQLLQPEKIPDGYRGVVLWVMPASNNGGCASINKDCGGLEEESTLPRQIIDAANEKAQKIRNSNRCSTCNRKWLVLEARAFLRQSNALRIKEEVQESHFVRQWDKVVLISRLCEPYYRLPPPNLYFWTLWESTNQHPLRNLC